MSLVKQSKKVYPVPDGMPLDLVSEAYERGGEPRVRMELGLEDWPDDAMNRLVARALREYPIDFDTIEMIEGVHDGLAARALHGSLTSPDPELRHRGAELLMRKRGLLQPEKEGAAIALEALRDVCAILAGQKPHERVTVTLDASEEAFTFPEPT